MSFQIRWKPKPLKYLKKLPGDVALRIWNKVDALKQNPFRYLEHYEGGDFYEFRIGEYRILIDIDFKRKILFIEVLDKRSRIYKR